MSEVSFYWDLAGCAMLHSMRVGQRGNAGDNAKAVERLHISIPIVTE